MEKEGKTKKQKKKIFKNIWDKKKKQFIVESDFKNVTVSHDEFATKNTVF